ncbi:MAG: thiamine-phosphate kinase [Thermoleophilaceae bacterium]|nr:thiamine-phosphate kinase [Thermoleophilaceae bacterium]
MSEAARIRSLVARFGGRSDRLVVPSGDDAAVARPAGTVLVTSIDAVVQDVHFQLPLWPLEAVGHKAVAAALSDLAAMGASAGEIYVAAGLPRAMSDEDFDALCDGIAAAASCSGAVVAGGDLSSAGELWLSVTVIGYAADEDSIVTRYGARAGDIVVVTGELGASQHALNMISSGVASGASDPRLARQFAPTPRFAAGAALAASGATAMIDISDGLARDAGHIASASGVGLTIELSSIPLAAGITDASSAASSGEEYELLATVPQEKLEFAIDAVAETGTTLTAIGQVTEGSEAQLLDAAGARVELRGFDHFD